MKQFHEIKSKNQLQEKRYNYIIANMDQIVSERMHKEHKEEMCHKKWKRDELNSFHDKWTIRGKENAWQGFIWNQLLSQVHFVLMTQKS